MNAVVLCPGPSLAALSETPYADFVIGVNRAVLAHACDWWSVSDYQTIQVVTPIGTPELFTTRASAAQLALPDGLRFEDVTIPPASGVGATGWSLFSATAAMALAYHLGARRIEVYGADMEGVEDYDGCADCRNTRTVARWNTEKGNVRNLMRWIEANGGELVGMTV